MPLLPALALLVLAAAWRVLAVYAPALSNFAPLMALTLVIASFAGALTGVALISGGHGDLQRRLPFGTFLAAAAVFASLWGQPIVDWYAGLYR